MCQALKYVSAVQTGRLGFDLQSLREEAGYRHTLIIAALGEERLKRPVRDPAPKSKMDDPRGTAPAVLLWPPRKHTYKHTRMHTYTQMSIKRSSWGNTRLKGGSNRSDLVFAYSRGPLTLWIGVEGRVPRVTPWTCR